MDFLLSLSPHVFPPQQTIGAWRVIFFVTVALYIVEIVAYTCMGSGEEQLWNKPEKAALSPKKKRSVENGEGGEGVENTPLNVRESKSPMYTNTEEE